MNKLKNLQNNINFESPNSKKKLKSTLKRSNKWVEEILLKGLPKMKDLKL